MKKNESNQPVNNDEETVSNVIVVGETGEGKTIFLNQLINKLHDGRVKKQVMKGRGK